MNAQNERRQVTLEEEGRLLARADVQPLDPPGTVQAAVHVEPGHLPPGTRERLVDEVLDADEVKSAERVKAVLPKGDAEALERVRARLEDSTSRAAGASVVVEGGAPRPGQDRPSEPSED